MSKQIKVLFFDDEANNLVSFKAAFRQHFTIYTTTDLEVARRVLQQEGIHVVLSDQRMPEISGVDFLAELQRVHPKIMRILITGYSDIDSVIDAINKGRVYSYISKPWDEGIVIETVKSAYAEYRDLESARSGKDDIGLLTEMAEDYVCVLQDSKGPCNPKKVVEKVNGMVRLSQELLAYYALEDTKNNLSLGTTKSKRLSFKDYTALIRIHDVKMILSNSPVDPCDEGQAANFQMLLQAATCFSSIGILPDTGRQMLQEHIHVLQ